MVCIKNKANKNITYSNKTSRIKHENDQYSKYDVRNLGKRSRCDGYGSALLRPNPVPNKYLNVCG